VLKTKLNKTQKILLVLAVGFFTTLISADEDPQFKNKEKQLNVISSLQWGEVLFYYFNGDKMESLIRLYARESRNKLQPHQDQADLLAAGLLLDLGLASEAQERLSGIGHENLNEKLNSRLSLIMARVYFQNQNLNLARQWLGKVVELHLSDNELVRKKMMYAQLLFNEGKFVESASELENIDNKGNLQLYSEYNHGLSLLQLSNLDAQIKGRLLLSNISNIEPVDQEQYGLIDQSKLALGLDAINSNLPIKAREHFIGIRLDGLVSGDALLLLGWTYAQTEEFDVALTYWNRLAVKSTLFEPTVQEAWLAVPYAHQKLGDFELAVKGYEEAIGFQLKALEQLNKMQEEHSWKVLLLSSDSKQQDRLDKPFFPQGFERQLIADPRFYTYLKEWRELTSFEEKLRENLTILPTLSLVLKENESRYIQKSTVVKEKLMASNRQGFVDEHQQLSKELGLEKSKIVAEKLLSKENYSHWLKLESAQSFVDEIPSEVGIEKIEKIRRLKGVAQWNFHRQRDENTWSAENDLTKLKLNLNELAQRIQSLTELSNKPRQATTAELIRVEELTQRGDNLVQLVVKLQQELEQAMSEEFLAFVKLRQTALFNLAEQANLALARLRFKAIKESLIND
jgi:DNA polymerase IIIc chi subunit